MASESLLADPIHKQLAKPMPLGRVAFFVSVIAGGLFLACYWLLPTGPQTVMVSKPALSELVSGASKGMAMLVSTFDGPNGLTGLVIKGNSETGKKRIAWSPAGSNVLIFGPVVDKNGRDLTALAEITQIRNPEHTNGFQPGQMGSYIFKKGQGFQIRQLYIVVSPSCPTCQVLLQKIRNPSTSFADDVQVALIPIGHSDSERMRGARLLETGSFDGNGSPAPPSARSIAIVARNTRQLIAQSNSGIKTPMLLYGGQIAESFDPFIVPQKTDRTASVQ